MNEQLGLLVHLQELCTNLDQLCAKRDRLPLDIEAARQSVLQSQAEYEKIQARYEVINRDRKNKEIDLTSHEGKLAKQRGRITEIKTNKEYHALLAEIETAKKVRENLEEDLLLLMEQVEEVGRQIEEKKKAVEEERKRSESQQQKMQAEIVETEGLLKQAEGEVKGVEEKLPKQLLKEYHQLRAARNGLAVALVKDGTCMGCRLAVPPQLYADVRKNEKILSCSYCRRYLYGPETILQAQSAG